MMCPCRHAQTGNTTWVILRILPRVFPPKSGGHCDPFASQFRNKILSTMWDNLLHCQPCQDNAEDRRIVTHCYLKANGKRLESVWPGVSYSRCKQWQVAKSYPNYAEFGFFGFGCGDRPLLCSTVFMMQAADLGHAALPFDMHERGHPSIFRWTQLQWM